MEEAKIIIGNEVLPTPSSINVSIEDLDSEASFRPISTGVLERDVIRQGMLALDLSYNLSTFNDVMKILKMTKPKDFNVELYLPEFGIRGTLKMYSSKKSYQYKRVQGGLKPSAFTLRLVEC